MLSELEFGGEFLHFLIEDGLGLLEVVLWTDQHSEVVILALLLAVLGVDGLGEDQNVEGTWELGDCGLKSLILLEFWAYGILEVFALFLNFSVIKSFMSFWELKFLLLALSWGTVDDTIALESISIGELGEVSFKISLGWVSLEHDSAFFVDKHNTWDTLHVVDLAAV